MVASVVFGLHVISREAVVPTQFVVTDMVSLNLEINCSNNAVAADFFKIKVARRVYGINSFHF